LARKSPSLSFHPEVLGTVQTRVLGQLGPLLRRWRFYLAGGTALALYFGHRRSLDLDWFTADRILDPLRLAQNLRDKGVPFITGHTERGTLHGTVSEVRVSLLEYRYPLLKPLVSWPQGGADIAPLEDLACMKLAALAQRRSKKDFVDVYALSLQHKPLRDLLRLYQRKYAIADVAHVLYGLTYFHDADKERMPKMLWDTDWRTIKQTIQGWVREIAGER
jgi:predicted nucleotidyltransferase component of viral defense system